VGDKLYITNIVTGQKIDVTDAKLEAKPGCFIVKGDKSDYIFPNNSYVLEKKKDEGCFITSACARARGLPDDCRELTILRSYRDTYLRGTEDGRRLIGEYYAVAPQIVAAIDRSTEAAGQYTAIYEHLVRPAVAAIDQGRLDDALVLYADWVAKLSARFLA